jgi:RNA polymerase sigma-70 factor (ECF subfamily)
VVLSGDDGGAHAPDVDALYRAHGRTVLRWATRLGGPGIDAEDVVHDVFVVAKRRLRAFAGPGQVTTWLFRTTQRVVQAARRKQRLRRWLSLSNEAGAAGISSTNPTPGDALERRRDVETVYRILDRLPERQRQILILFEMEEMPTEEIGELMGAKGSTVRVWLFRARARFLAEHERLFSRERDRRKDEGR